MKWLAIVLNKGLKMSLSGKHYFNLANIFQFHLAQKVMCVFLTVCCSCLWSLWMTYATVTEC